MGESSSRLLLVLPHSLHVRNFVASGLLERLVGRGHRAWVLVPAEFVEPVRAAVTGVEAVKAIEPYLGGRVKGWFRQRFVSASFVRRRHFSTYAHKLRQRRRVFWSRLETETLLALSRLGDLERAAVAAEARLPVSRQALSLLSEIRPDLLFSATFIHDCADLELIKAARRLGIPVMAFPATWDTLTSKGCFLAHPNHVLAWGEETFRHAVSYHGFAPLEVTVTGAPHFDIYGPDAAVEPRSTFLGSRGIAPEKRVILFAGTTISYMADEPLQLQTLSRLIAEGRLGDCHIWYRPHPRRRARDLEGIRTLPGVFVDDRVLAQKSRMRSAYSADAQDLLHCRNLLEAVDGVITAFSTMIIEAALLGKPSLVIGFGLGDASEERLLHHANYEHMRDVVTAPGVAMCRNLEELIAGIGALLSGEMASFSELLRKWANEVACNLDGRARERIVAAIERSLDGKRRRAAG